MVEYLRKDIFTTVIFQSSILLISIIHLWLTATAISDVSNTWSKSNTLRKHYSISFCKLSVHCWKNT